MTMRQGRQQYTWAKLREAKKHHKKALLQPIPYPWPLRLRVATCLSPQELTIFCLSRPLTDFALASLSHCPPSGLRHLQPWLLGESQGPLLVHQPLRHLRLLISVCDSFFLFIFPVFFSLFLAYIPSLGRKKKL